MICACHILLVTNKITRKHKPVKLPYIQAIRNKQLYVKTHDVNSNLTFEYLNHVPCEHKMNHCITSVKNKK